MKKITNNTSKAKSFAKKDKYNKGTQKFTGKNTKGNAKGYLKTGVSPDTHGTSKAKSGGKASAPKPKEGSFLYLLPDETSAKELQGVLDFLGEKQLEVWTELNLLEVTVDEGTVTFEDMKDNLSGEDFKTLEVLEVKKVYAVDYYLSDRGVLRKIMEALISEFGGKIGSDTEDFQPFLNIREI